MTFPAQTFDYIGVGGIGQPASTMAHSMAWFDGHLVVGTTASKAAGPEDRARILRWLPDSRSWEVLYESPLMAPDAAIAARVQARGGKMAKNTPAPAQIAREFGVRSLCVFQGPSDPAPCLYAGVMSFWGGMVLRSADGRTFAPVTTPGLGDSRVLSFRGLCKLEGKLFTSPAGTVSETVHDRNLAPQAMVYVSEDPASGLWLPACAEGFGDPANRSVFSLAAAHGHIYAGTASPSRGFQLWRTDAKGPAPYRWERVLTDGAWRFNHNLSTVAMTEFNGDLYVGSGIAGLGYDQENDVGPAAGELIRLRPDGSWDLIFGEPRFTPDGFKVPLSAMGPGLDDPYNSVIWSMCVHEGALYIGTHQWEPFDLAMHGKGAPLRGGYQLWASTDGTDWTRLIDAGAGRVTAIGLRSMQSTPLGLFLGTCVHTKLLQLQARMRSGLADIGEDSSGFDILLGR